MTSNTPSPIQNNDVGITGNVQGRNVNVGGEQHIHYHQTTPPEQQKSIPEQKSYSRLMQVMRDPAIQTLLAILGIAILIVPGFLSTREMPASPTVTGFMPTPMTPIVEALRDLEIHSGPDAAFDDFDVLRIGSNRDIMGISKDNKWYQILLLNGTTGWVLSAESGARLNGNRSVLKLIVPTLTPTITPTNTPLPTDTPTLTFTPTGTPSPTASFTPTATDTFTPTYTVTMTDVPTSPALTDTPGSTPMPASTVTSTNEPVNPVPPVSSPTPDMTGAKQYPCDATVSTNATGSLFVVYNRADMRLSPIASLIPGSVVKITDQAQSGGHKWYRIIYGENQQTGWVWDNYLKLSDQCP